MAITKNEVMEWIDQATMLEISDLVKSLEEKYGISAAAAMPMVMARRRRRPRQSLSRKSRRNLPLFSALSAKRRST